VDLELAGLHERLWVVYDTTTPFPFLRETKFHLINNEGIKKVKKLRRTPTSNGLYFSPLRKIV